MDTNVANQHDASPGEAPKPKQIADARAFLAGTGRMFSLAGLALMVVSGCIGLFGGGLLGRPAMPAENAAAFFTPERLPFTLKCIGLLTAILGGLTMQAVGLALSAELGRGAWAGAVVCELMTLLWLVCGVMLTVREGNRVAGIVLIALGVLTVIPTLFSLRCIHLARLLPPVDRGRLGREAWEAYEKRRRR